MTARSPTPWWTGVPVTVAVGAGWIALAVANPTTTYHFAPTVLAAALPVSRRMRTEDRLSPRSLIVATSAGLGLALSVTAVLAWLGALAGPTFVGTPAAGTETVVMAAVGAVVAVAYGRKPARGNRANGTAEANNGEDPAEIEHPRRSTDG
ncbi:hypothetical protein [Haloechinothrix halophila]|uniref:hypothetical protein n=1 Tax=Haloechinothrix halophila TaxID=1069073 RepID=UPI0003FEC63E|nr:hypothetical protein [Haloechinothrix halophila]